MRGLSIINLCIFVNISTGKQQIFTINGFYTKKIVSYFQNHFSDTENQEKNPVKQSLQGVKEL